MRQKLNQAILVCLILFQGVVSFAQIPTEYLPNSHINSAWTSILNTLTELQAYKKTGNDVPASMFASLNANFKTAFQYFPSNPSYNVIYKQCDITTAKLAKQVNYDDYNIFISKCFDPLSNILRDIQTNFTVTSNIKANPRAGQVPLSVTFDASSSIDPSKETIPSENFFWYYTDTDKQDVIIGKGPIVNHTFTKPGNYVIHSTVRSINNLKGYFDADQTIIISAQPTDTKINILANGTKLDENNPTKLSLSEGTDGVVLDASSSTTAVGKKLVSYTRNITSNDGFNRTSNGEGAPGAFTLKLGNKWTYKVTLTATDNTNTTTSKSFQIILSDPVSKIKANPSAWSTSTQFAFDGDTSYSVSSKINLYRWDVYDADSNVLITSQDKNLRYQFTKPGIYTVKLTISDEQGLSDSSQMKITVESTAPVAQFATEATSKRSEPSEFILDATNSFDYDVLNSNDKLSYSRWFSDPDNTIVSEQSSDQKQIKVQFNTKGTHKVKLKVTDSFGKSSEITKDIVITSSLRPVITVNPIAAPRGSKIDFSATSNKSAVSYVWDFGDGNTRTLQSPSISHIFDKVGVYKVSLTVTSNEGERNTVSTLVYIGENNAPIWVYDILGPTNQLMLPSDTCSGVAAFSIPRYQTVTIDSSKSVDTKGQRNNVKTLFKPQNDDVFNTSQLRYRFGEIGCQFVDMIVEDKEELTADKKRLWFKVKNGLPKLNNITIAFPQYQNDVWIWLFQYNAPKDPSFEQFDPLVVRVSMEGWMDLDGSISYIAWYYYKPEDPERLLDIKITPGNSSSVNFAISREAWEYTFGAKIVDNDWGEVTSEGIIGKGPSIFIKPKGNDSIDIPLVSLKADIVNTNVGDEVTFTVNSRVLSNRPDFKANRIIKYDFDGDGVDDLTTKDDIVKYVYTSPTAEGRLFKPKAKVIYREKVGVGYAEPITVKKWLKPNFLVASYDKKVLIRDVSYGTDDKTKIEYCMDKNNCNKNTLRDGKTFTYEYDSYGSKTIVLTATDAYGNTVKTEKTIELKAPEKRLYISLLSTPDNKQIDNGFSIDVGKSLDNQIIIYPQYFGSGKCYLDTNLVDGDDDNDLECNKLHTLQVKSIGSKVYYKLWYENAKELTSKIITVNLIDNQIVVVEQYKEVANEISSMIEKYSNKKGYENLITILQNLAQSLGDKEKTTEYLIDLDNETKATTFWKETLDEIKSITDELANAGFRATQGLSEYERTKAEVLAYANPTLEAKLIGLFDKIETTSDKNQIYSYLSELLTLYAQEVSAGTVDQADYAVIKDQVCKIVSIKEIPGTKCTNGEIQVTTPETVNNNTSKTSADDSGTDGGSSVLKWILWIIWISVLIFWALVVIFAIKARMDRAKADSEKTEDSTP